MTKDTMIFGHDAIVNSNNIFPDIARYSFHVELRVIVFTIFVNFLH